MARRERGVTGAYDLGVRSRLGALIVVCSAGIVPTACADDGPTSMSRATEHPSHETAGPDTDALLQAAVALRVAACRPIPVRGAGLLIAPGMVLTAAHVVAGATSIVAIGSTGVEAIGEVVAFDPHDDLAVVAVPVPLGVPLPLTADPPTGAFAGEVVLFRQDVASVVPVRAIRRVTINTEDIYRGGPTSRPGYEVQASVLPGDSGGVVVRDGEAVAVMWSRSRLTEDRAWAIDPIRGGSAIRAQLEAGRVDDEVDLTRCA